MESNIENLLTRTRRLTSPHLGSFSHGGEIFYLSRILFGLVVALVLWLEEPHERGSAHTWLPLAFAMLSLILLSLTTTRAPEPRLAVMLHLSDLLFSFVVLVLGETVILLFFMWSTFCLLSAASQWHWRAVAATGLMLTATYFLCLALEEVDTERALIRIAYLVGATTLIAVVTRRRDRSRKRLLKIAAWASRRFEETKDGLRNVLNHACDVLEARQVVVFWKETGEWRQAHFYVDGCGLRVTSAAYAGEDLLPEALRGQSFIWCKPHLWLTRKGKLKADGAAAVQSLGFGPQIRPICSVALKGQICQGRLFVLELSEGRSEFLTYGELMAAHVLRRLEGSAVRRQRLASAIETERARWARDLHDGLLQSMTAMRLHLNAALKQPEFEILQREACRASDLLRAEQERLRGIVEGSRQASGNKSVPLRRLAEMVDEVAAHWDLRAEVDAEPMHAVIPHRIFRELSFLVSEAVANAARHGIATHVRCSLTMQQRMLQVTFSNAVSPEVPVLERSAPRSMTERVLDLGGTLTFEVESDRVLLTVQVPVHE